MPNSFQRAFANTTMRTNFSLNLTQPMIEYLCAVADDVWWDRARYHGNVNPDNWLATGRALERRGLIVHKPRRVRERESKRVSLDNSDHHHTYKLTPIGRKVCELLLAGGIFRKAELADELGRDGLA